MQYITMTYFIGLLRRLKNAVSATIHSYEISINALAQWHEENGYCSDHFLLAMAKKFDEQV